MPSRLFPDTRTTPPQKKAMAEALMAEAPGLTLDEAQALLQRQVLPPSRAWAFCRNGKTATTSVLTWLFQLEFGVALSVNRAEEHNLTDNALGHFTIQADVFRPAGQIVGGLAALKSACRIVTVRHPATRALSGFRYLCLSDQRGAELFMADRVRLAAETGFDWQRDPLTPRGFGLYLDYVQILHETRDTSAAAVHWRGQVQNLRPEVLPPTVIARVEALEQLPRDLAPHLARPLPEAGFRRLNVQPPEGGALLADPGLRRRLAEVFHDDFTAFDYDPGHIPGGTE